MHKIVYKIVLLILLGITVNSCKLPKAFNALEVYNYFQAKTYFEKVEKRHPVAAKYGLSLIYQRNDNPFYNLDSAYKTITYAIVNYDSLTMRLKEKYAEIGVDSNTILAHQKLVATDMFQRALSINSESGFQDFIEKNPTSRWVERSVLYRDSLCFVRTIDTNTANAYQNFMDKYPNSSFFYDAKNRFDRRVYVEHTENEDLRSYISFTQLYPDNPFAVEAENQVYKIVTEGKTVASYEHFIKQYPKNRNIRLAWQQLYDAYLTENLAESAIADFIAKYPENPFKHQVESDLELSKTFFYPVQKNGKWGFKSETGKYMISNSFDYVEPFTEGLAIVMKDQKIGFITKSGDQKIGFNFDDAFPFNEGCAIVEVNEKYGMIDRQGAYILQPNYNYLGQLKNGLVPFQKDSLYGYFNKKGQTVIAPVFSDAYDFIDSMAKVNYNGRWGLIDSKGNYVFEPEYESITVLQSKTYKLCKNDTCGVLGQNKDTLVPFLYDDVSGQSDGFYVVTKNDSFNFISENGHLLFGNEWCPVYPEYKILAKYQKKPILIITDKGYNYMELNGKNVFKESYESMGEYSELIAYRKDNKWGYLSTYPAEVVIKPTFDNARSFKNGFGIVSLAPFWGMVNANGEFMVNAFYEELAFLTSEILMAKGKGKYGLLSTKGDTLLPFSDSKIEPFQLNIVKVSNENNVSYYNLIQNKWIRKEE